MAFTAPHHAAVCVGGALKPLATMGGRRPLPAQWIRLVAAAEAGGERVPSTLGPTELRGAGGAVPMIRISFLLG